GAESLNYPSEVLCEPLSLLPELTLRSHIRAAAVAIPRNGLHPVPGRRLTVLSGSSGKDVQAAAAWEIPACPHRKPSGVHCGASLVASEVRRRTRSQAHLRRSSACT